MCFDPIFVLNKSCVAAKHQLYCELITPYQNGSRQQRTEGGTTTLVLCTVCTTCCLRLANTRSTGSWQSANFNANVLLFASALFSSHERLTMSFLYRSLSTTHTIDID